MFYNLKMINKNNTIFLFLLIFSGFTLNQELSPDQIEMVRQAVEANNSSYIDSEVADDEIEESTLPVKVVEDSNLDMQGKKYGYDFFSTISTSISGRGDLPLPNDYKISLRDELTLILSGSKDAIYDLNVKLDGTILIPELGSIYIVNKDFGEVKELLSNLISQSYIGVNIDIMIKNVSAKKISIVGAVKSPGTYLVNPFSTITSALSYSGGISKIGTLRNIKLIRNNGKVFEFDLYDLLIKGDRSRDISVEAGDTILIEPAKNFISLDGAVNRPAVYEYLDGESVSDIVFYGLGFKKTANESKVSLSILDKQSNSLNQKEIDDLSFILENVTEIEVFDFPTEPNKGVRVYGAVDQPGYYKLSDFPSLESLITSLKFVEVYPWLAALEQFDEDLNLRETILFSLKDPTTYASINLLPNSKVFFFNNRDPINKDMLKPTTVANIDNYSLNLEFRSVKYPMPVAGKFRASDFIDFLGFDMTDVDPIASYVSPIDDIVIRKDYREMTIETKKFHSLSFRVPENNIINVSISGEIEFPGSYSLSPSSSLQDLYLLAGTFTSNAFKKGIILNRDSAKAQQLRAIEEAKNTINDVILSNAQKGSDVLSPELLVYLNKPIDTENLGRVSGNLTPGSELSQAFTLQDGDEVFVPKNPFTVTVVGEVFSPGTIIYDDKYSFKDLIESAGGFKEYADISNIYIISADGSTKQARRNIFLQTINIEIGDTVVVPRKINIRSTLSDSLLPLTQLLSDLAFSSAAIDSLKSN